MDWLVEYALPVAGAVFAGALIGFEREYRGRPAGFRTHILVCLTASLLMLAAVHQVRWLTDTPNEIIRIDPVRMAHGILTGVGFLCGGVIFREGFSVHGLTTAASLWITSALGTLFGVGFYGLAIGGTLTTLAVLAGLRWIDFNLPHVSHADVSIRYGRDAAPGEAEFQALIGEFGLKTEAVRQTLTPDVFLQLSATVRGRGPVPLDDLARRLKTDPHVVAFDLAPRHE
ncbi:MgtC/SapB family protein [Phenylobacterium sp.]|uniref:MgtC/SapB family protein n=1 Tax=Phenylobacterium sp. TaxID=1871053 RepID=UPI00286CB9CB|nr:MgtC/SapB family protein [Phenylobacterium sp.]